MRLERSAGQPWRAGGSTERWRTPGVATEEADHAGVRWPLPADWDDSQVERTLFPQRPVPAFWRKHPEPDWAQIHQELQTHKDLTLQLVWQDRACLEADAPMLPAQPLLSHPPRGHRHSRGSVRWLGQQERGPAQIMRNYLRRRV
jgi:hypothetical protein